MRALRKPFANPVQKRYPAAMRSILVCVVVLALGMVVATAQEENESSSLNALEKAFETRMEKAVFEGQWCLVKDGKMGPWKADKYTIQSARKIEGDTWVITSRIQFGNVDVNVPLTVKVFWSGDTPVISVTDLPVPGAGTYTARVLVYEDTYAGTWFGKGYGGLMTGTVRAQ
jgi:hypothetical protein